MTVTVVITAIVSIMCHSKIYNVAVSVGDSLSFTLTVTVVHLHFYFPGVEAVTSARFIAAPVLRAGEMLADAETHYCHNV